MGRPRRGAAAAIGGKENASGNTSATPRVVSRPWDNLKLDTPPPAPDPPQMRYAPRELCAAAAATAKLPHERFTPLLRTTFNEEDERKRREADQQATRVPVHTNVTRSSSSYIKTTVPTSAMFSASHMEERTHALDAPLQHAQPMRQRSMYRHSIRDAPARMQDGHEYEDDEEDEEEEQHGDFAGEFDGEYEEEEEEEEEEDEEEDDDGDEFDGDCFVDQSSNGHAGVGLSFGGPSFGGPGDGFGTGTASAVQPRPRSRHSVRMTARHSSVRNSAARHSVRGAPKPVTGGMYSSDEDDNFSDLDVGEKAELFEHNFGGEDNVEESASQTGAFSSSLAQTTVYTGTSVTPPGSGSSAKARMQAPHDNTAGHQHHFAEADPYSVYGSPGPLSVTDGRGGADARDEDDDENFIFVQADTVEDANEARAHNERNVPPPLMVSESHSPMASENSRPPLADRSVHPMGASGARPPVPPPGPGRPKQGSSPEASGVSENDFPSLRDFLSYEKDRRMKTQSVRQREVKYTPPDEAEVGKELQSHPTPDYDGPDTFDTFASESVAEYRMNPTPLLGNVNTKPHNKESSGAVGSSQPVDTSATGMDLQRAPSSLSTPHAAPRLATNESEKPSYPNISADASPDRPVDKDAGRHFIDLKPRGGRLGSDDDDDGNVFDAPPDMVRSPGIEPALRDLQRASIRAGNELALTAFAIGTAQREGSPGPEKVSRVQGQLLLRTRILRRWVTRFASIVDHQYFGAVLFLFCCDGATSDARSRKGAIGLRNSKMIVLADTSVREIEINRRAQRSALFELRTAQRKYVFACEDNVRREFWLSNLTTCVG